MSTPMFKVLAQSLRLGQPPDPTSALRVLVEVAEKQQAEIEDLRAKLTIATSRLQYAEARLARIADPAPAGSHEPPASTRQPEGARTSARPPAHAAPEHAAVAHPPLAIPGAPRTPEIAMASAPLVDTGLDDFNQTLVIDKRDVASVAGQEAPFPLPPASERPRASTRAGGTPFQGPDEEATRRARRSVPPPPPPRPPPPTNDGPDAAAGLASEALSFDGDVTVTEQMSRSQMSRAAQRGEPRRGGRDGGDPE